MEVTAIRSSRTSWSIQVREHGEVVIHVPLGFTDRQIIEALDSKRDWILKYVKQTKELNENAEKLSAEEIDSLAKKALEVFPAKVIYYAPMVGVKPGHITIRNQKTKWGSCSGKGNLNFNCLLMLMDDEIVNYIVVHELCHLKEMNHSPRFWAEVERVIPNYREIRKRLREEGKNIMARNL